MTVDRFSVTVAVRTVAFCLLTVAIASHPLKALDFNVDHCGDTQGLDDINPGDGICSLGGVGLCTLRAAVQETNALAGPDRIFLPASGCLIGFQGQVLGIEGELEIVSQGAEVTEIVASSHGLFDVRGVFGPAMLTVRDVRLSSIEVFQGDLELVDVHYTGDLVSAGATSTITALRTRFVGGRIANLHGGSVELVDSEMSGSVVPEIEDGAAIRDDAGGFLRLVRTVVRDNQARFGGAIWTKGGELVLDSSSLINNSAVDRAAVFLTDGALVELVNSTLAGNVALNSGGGLHVCSTCAATIHSSTISHNVADADGTSVPQDGKGGGIFVAPGGAVSLTSSILAQNFDLAGTGHTRAHECSGTVDSGDFNVMRSTILHVCVVTGSTANNRIPSGVDVSGLTLAARLPVLLPLAGGVAIDAGTATGCTDGGGAPLATDQVGSDRAIDGDGNGSAVCDPGAVESVTPLIFADGFETGTLIGWSTVEGG